MAWQDELTTIVRVLINDVIEPYEFSNERLYQVIAVSAKYLQFDVVLNTSYTIDVVNSSISPDPTVGDTYDDVFISMVCLKAACIVDQATYRTKAALEGVRAVLGPAALSVAGNSQAWQNIIEHGACKAYDDLVDHWDISNATVASAILGPFSGNKFNPDYQNARQNYNHRNGFFN